jgi:hypothetical protein
VSCLGPKADDSQAVAKAKGAADGKAATDGNKEDTAEGSKDEGGKDTADGSKDEGGKDTADGNKDEGGTDATELDQPEEGSSSASESTEHSQDVWHRLVEMTWHSTPSPLGSKTGDRSWGEGRSTWVMTANRFPRTFRRHRRGLWHARRALAHLTMTSLRWAACLPAEEGAG